MTSHAPIVVVVDDDPGMLRAMARMIEVAGMTAVTHASAEAVLADPREGVRCMVIDVQLPGMDGLRLYELLTARVGVIPAVFVSASEEAEARVRALDGGSRTFLAKPFSGHALLDAVKRLLGEAA